MTAHHAPYTTPLSPAPLWRRVISLPQTRLGWLAVGLSGIALALMTFTNVMGFVNTDNPQLAILGVSGEASGFAGLSGVGKLYALTGFSALAGGAVALLAWLQRHRSEKPR